MGRLAQLLPHGARPAARHADAEDGPILHEPGDQDGGVARDTIHACWRAGADTFVAGNAVFMGADPAAEIRAALVATPRAPASSARRT